MANDIIDINVYETVETVAITVNPNLTTVNINQVTSSGGGTNLSTTQTASNFTINSDTGDDALVPLGNGTLAGATLNDYTTAEKNKLVDTYTKGEVDTKITGVYKIKGSVANYAALPSSGQVIGDVWNLLDTGGNYVWTGTVWDALGTTVDISGKANIDSPTFTGIPLAPTAVAGTNNTQIATTAFTTTAIAGKMNNPSLTASYIPKALTTTTIGNSRLLDTGTVTSTLGIGVVNTPLKDITLGYQANRSIGIEDSESINAGKSLAIEAGRAINFIISPLLVDSSLSSNSATNLFSDYLGNIYISSFAGGLYKQTGGVGTFTLITNSTSKGGVTGGCVAPNGDIYICSLGGVGAGDIYKQAGGAGSFVALGVGNLFWRSMCATPNGDIYASVGGNTAVWGGATGDIYKQVSGTTGFVAMGFPSRNYSICSSPNGDVFAAVNGGSIYKISSGTTVLTDLVQTVRTYQAITTNGTDVFTVVYNGDICKQTNNTGVFQATGQVTRGYNAILITNSSILYATGYAINIYTVNLNSLGTANLQGGTLKLNAGTGKGTGTSDIEIYTGQVLSSGTDMQTSTLRAKIDNTGLMTLPSVTNSLINGDATGKAVATKEYVASVIGVGGATNLTTTQTISNFTINSDTGTDASVPLGNGTLAGATLNDYTTAEKNKLAAITGTNTGDNATNTTSNAYADARVSDAAYDATSWNGVTTVAPSKNAIRDKIQSTGLQEITDINASTTNPINVTVTGASVGITGGSPNGKGINGYSDTGIGVDGFSTSGIAINGYSETGVAGSFDVDGTANIANFKSSGTLVAFVNSAGELTAQKLKKDGGTSSQILAADGSVITAGTNITITGGQISSVGGAGGGGSSVNYYLNGGTSQGTFGGTTYYEFSKTAVIGTGADFSRGTNGLIASFITDIADPSLLLIPAGNWNLEFFFNSSSAGGSPSFYVELYKYDGTTFTSIASNSATPEGITGGTAIDAYFTPLAVPETVLTVNDRLAIRVFVNASSKTITLHTQNGHLCEVITTFTAGLTALNGLQAQVQNFATGTTGTDFDIVSSGSTHTFNLPSASTLNRGVVTIASQTFAGDKTFTGAIGASNLSNTNTGDNATNTQYSGLAASKQDTLQNTVNIKSINGNTILGSGDLTISASPTSQSAYTMLANNTNASAIPTTQPFENLTNQVYSGTIVWTGGAAPSGTTDHTYSLSQIGNLVTLTINLAYGTAGGATVSSVTMELPSTAPTPALPSSVTTALDVVNYGTGMIISSKALATTAAAFCALRLKSTAPNIFEIVISRVASTHRYAYATIQYFV